MLTVLWFIVYRYQYYIVHLKGSGTSKKRLNDLDGQSLTTTDKCTF